MDEKGAKIVPATKSHAIEVMAFAVEWLNPITASDFTDILTIYDGSAYLRQHLPRKNGIEGFKIQLIQGSGVPMASSAADEIAGYDFQQFLPDGTMSWSVAIRPNFISCNCSTYDRWKTTKATALSLLMPFLDCIVGKTADRKISGFGLQYQDMFKLEGNISAFSLQQLLRMPNRRIPSIAFEHQSFWHVHQGWFSETSGRRRVLNLLNIDYLEQAGLYAFRINGQHRMLSVDIHSAERPQALAELSDALDHMHDLNKTVLSELLNDTVLLQIGMDTRPKYMMLDFATTTGPSYITGAYRVRPAYQDSQIDYRGDIVSLAIDRLIGLLKKTAQYSSTPKFDFSAILTEGSLSGYRNFFQVIDRYGDLPASWDGPGSRAPTLHEIEQAKFALLTLLLKGLPPPRPMLLREGTVGAYWKGVTAYASIDFEDDGEHTWAATDGKVLKSGVWRPENPIPEELKRTISST